MGRIEIARVYDFVGQDPSGRFLADRLWPRGLAKAGAPFEYWAKDVSPSSALRTWYGHAESRFEEFADRYRGELARPAGRSALDDLRARIAAATSCCSRRRRSWRARTSACSPRCWPTPERRSGRWPPGCYSPPVRRRSSATRSAIGTRTCSVVSRSRTVTASSSRESKSTVTHHGVPISSWRR